MTIPVIASSGAGAPEHFAEVLNPTPYAPSLLLNPCWSPYTQVLTQVVAVVD